MSYRKITLEVILDEDGAEVYIQALNNALNRIEETQSVNGSEMRDKTRRRWESSASPASPVISGPAQAGYRVG